MQTCNVINMYRRQSLRLVTKANSTQSWTVVSKI